MVAQHKPVRTNLKINFLASGNYINAIKKIDDELGDIRKNINIAN